MALDRLEEIAASLERGVVSRTDFGAYVAALSEADRLAGAYGFDVCGRVG